MRHTKQKLTGIIAEMTTYCYSLGGTRIETLLESDHVSHYITIKSDFDIQYLDRIKKLKEILNRGRNQDVEEMYWLLTGMSDIDDEAELQLITALIDKAEVYIENNQVTVYLIRHRMPNKNA